MKLSDFSFPTSIRFGAGSRHGIPGHLLERGLTRPLVVTDAGISRLPLFREFLALLWDGELTPSVFDGVEGNPVRSQVQAAARVFLESGSDSIIGFGGGAALDVAKAAGLLVSHPGDLFDYAAGSASERPIRNDLPYWIAVPTTAGTGSEVGRSSVISDDETRLKRILFSPRLLARQVFADPELTLGLPAQLTAATGMDALTHCIESYLARDFHPMCDAIALEGVRLISESLERCVREPGDIEARGNMLLASMMGAVAFQKGLGVTHACAHALGTVADLHHGLANGILLDHALAFNAPVASGRMRTLAQAARVPAQAARAPEYGLIEWVRNLKTAIAIPPRIPSSLAENLRPRFEKLSEIAFKDPCHLNNPRECTLESMREIFFHALEGASRP